MDADLLKTMRRDMRPPAASSAELGERRGWNAALDAVAAALAPPAPAAPTGQPSDADALKAKVKEAIQLADNVGRSRGSNCYAMNSSAVAKLVNLEDEINNRIAALASSPVAPSPEPSEIARLVLELAEAVDNAANDIGGSRGQLDILRDAVIVAQRLIHG